MQSSLVEERAVKVSSSDGIDVYRIATDKFKTNTINIFFHDNLSREYAAVNALLPAVLRRGCERFPTFQDIALYLEELYGASFDCGVVKKGEQQIIQFYIEYVSDEYTGEDAGLFEKAFDLLYEIITRPVLENGALKKEYVDQEKENLKRIIEGRINDKVQYSIERCFEEMCRDEPFGIYEYGSVSDLERIDEKRLYNDYKRMITSLPVKMFVTGNIEDKRLSLVAQKLSRLRRENLKKVGTGEVSREIKEVRHITDRMDVNQGKLSLGFRTNIAAGDREYYSLLVYNGILGGGIHSKLFQNVREKASLAYYVFSRLEKFKGLMVIGSGIEADNKDRAVDIILKQLDEMKAGNISDYEFDATIKTIETGIKSLKDSQLQMVDFYLSQAVAGTNDTFDAIIGEVGKVTRQDVVNVAGRIELDTVYFLTSS